MSADRPWLKFYPQDWRADERLRNCSLSSRGLWIELLALMHRSERYGYLLINGKPPSERALAVQTGATVDEVREGLTELESEGVFSRDNEDILFSRRMVRDDEKHRKASTFGRRGVRAKARKDKEETPTLEGSLKPPHEGTHQLRGQRPDNPPVSPSLRVPKGKRELPDDWEPAEFGEATQSRTIVSGWSQLEFQRQLEAFRAHHRRDGNRYADWQAAWSTWVLNSQRFANRDADRGGARPNGSGAKSLVDQVLEEKERQERKQAAAPG